ncbi:MAG: DNA-binding protein [Candidatus Omnitrophota bacterium]
MMLKRILNPLWFINGLLFAAFFSFPLAVYAQAIPSSELINNAKQYDGKAVVYEGEVIGVIMERGGHVWLNVNDGKNSIGIWAQRNLVSALHHAGSYKAKGDWLAISGIFHRACLEHGGDLDIHALRIDNIKPGKAIPQRLNTGKMHFVLLLTGVLCLVLILRQLKRS